MVAKKVGYRKTKIANLGGIKSWPTICLHKYKRNIKLARTIYLFQTLNIGNQGAIDNDGDSINTSRSTNQNILRIECLAIMSSYRYETHKMLESFVLVQLGDSTVV